MCDNPDLPIIATCACGAYYRSCDYLDAMLHITPHSSLGHKWVYLKGNSFIAGRDNKTFNKRILIFDKPLQRGE